LQLSSDFNFIFKIGEELNTPPLFFFLNILMRSFKQFISEEEGGMANTSSGIYGSIGSDYFVDIVPTDFDVEEFTRKNKKLPWEVRNALDAEARRENVLKWLRAGATKNTVSKNSLPKVPGWQSRKY